MSKYHLFKYSRYEDRSGSMKNYVGVFDDLETLRDYILLDSSNGDDTAEVVIVNGDGKLEEIASYSLSTKWLQDDEHYNHNGPERWIDDETLANLSDGVILRDPRTQEERDNAPGTENNPWILPDDVIKGITFMRGMWRNGLFWNRDGGGYFKMPDGYPIPEDTI